MRPHSDLEGSGPFLQVLSGRFRGHRIDISAGSVTLGRGGDLAALLSGDPTVSRAHARLYRSADGQTYIEDLASANGTFVNGFRLSAATALNNNDIMRIGNMEFGFVGISTRLTAPEDETQQLDNAHQLLSQGHRLLDEGEFDRSAQAFLRATSISPAASDGYYGLGMVALARGDMVAAEASLRYALELDPRNNNALFQLGKLGKRQGKRPGALDANEKALAVKAQHENAPAWFEALDSARRQTPDDARSSARGKPGREVLVEQEQHGEHLDSASSRVPLQDSPQSYGSKPSRSRFPPSRTPVFASAASDLLWARLPRRICRFSVNLAVLLSDGDYLQHWRAVAAFSPPLTFLAGVFLGAHQHAVVYTYSVALIAVLGAISGLAGSLGTWVWLGFVVSDFFLFDRTSMSPFDFSISWGERVLRIYFPLMISYMVLASLLVLLPLVGMRIRAQAGGYLVRLGAIGIPIVYACQAVGQGFLVFLWTQSTPFLIRPIWTFQGGGTTPDTAAIDPLQRHGLVIAAATGAAIMVRAILVMVTVRYRGIPVRPRPNKALGPMKTPDPPLWHRWASMAGAALFSTLLLSGVLADIGQGALVAGLIFAVLVIRRLVLPRVPVLPGLITRVPVIVRLGACVYVAKWLTDRLVAPAVTAGTDSFTSLLQTLVISFAVAAVLLPTPRPTQDASDPA